MSPRSPELCRFPRTPHLAWLAADAPRGDKVMSPAECQHCLSGDVVVEEKVDGANLGISLHDTGTLRVQNRGQYLEQPYAGQFSRLRGWLAMYQTGLLSILTPDLTLFGEWCAARHSVGYDRLPDWFVAFDVYDRRAEGFWDTERRDAIVANAGLHSVAILTRGRFALQALRSLLDSAPSAYRSGSVEGFVIRRESGGWLDERAKLVRPDFVQSIGEHWRRRAIEWNLLSASSNQRQTRALP
ncbi:MAG: DNA ligase [Gammaproteobacteria bacterium]|nr:DNA ligase [Gammaproteobacteria bacterium]